MGKRKIHTGKEMARPGKKQKYDLKTGIFSASMNGYGFVNTGGEGDVFIPPKHVGNAIDGDTVEAAVTNPDDPKGPSGKITRILARERVFIVGELLDRWTLRPLNRVLPSEIKISGGSKGAMRGDWVKARILDQGQKFTEELRCSVEEPLDRSSTVKGDLEAVMAEYDMPGPYDADTEAAADKIVPLELEREDLSDRYTMTLDPADARDFDDAISIVSHRSEWEIGVHIADVAVWVRPGTRFDKEAKKRGFSSYIPAMFRPMLPLRLTRKISMTPDRLSPAHTFLLHVRKRDGKVLSFRRVHSLVKVVSRLNYGDVQDFLDGKAIPGWDTELKKHLKMLADAVEKMRSLRREEEKFLQIDTPETRIFCEDESFKITGMENRMQTPSEALVEECMLAANTAAAQELLRDHIPGLFRIHEEPVPEKLEEFEAFAEAVLRRRTGDLSVRENAVKFLASIPDNHTKVALMQAFLRAMQRARYSPEAALHYGLGKMNYAHFTSPIRRYADLFIHQQFLAKDLKGRLRSGKTASETAEQLRRLEERNDEAYFAASDRLKLHYLNTITQGTARLFEGVIIKAGTSGLICDVPEFSLRGFVPASYLSGVSRRNPLRPGDLIYLFIDHLDFARGGAVFKPAR